MAGLRVDILTIFPDLFREFVQTSLLGRAQKAGILDVVVHDLRAWSTPPQRRTDDYAYGGGPGMVMMVEPIVAAVEDVCDADGRVVLMTPQGVPLTQARAAELAKHRNLVLICGRYEGVDDRVRTLVADEEISIGDYVLSGGEVAAMVVIDAVARLLPGVVGDATSLESESHGFGRLAYPQFTRPEEFRGQRVPPILLSGHHGRIDRWRRAQMLHRTRERRPDLLPDECLSAEDWALMQEFPAPDDEDSL